MPDSSKSDHASLISIKMSRATFSCGMPTVCRERRGIRHPHPEPFGPWHSPCLDAHPAPLSGRPSSPARQSPDPPSRSPSSAPLPSPASCGERRGGRGCSSLCQQPILRPGTFQVLKFRCVQILAAFTIIGCMTRREKRETALEEGEDEELISSQCSGNHFNEFILKRLGNHELGILYIENIQF